MRWQKQRRIEKLTKNNKKGAYISLLNEQNGGLTLWVKKEND